MKGVRKNSDMVFRWLWQQKWKIFLSIIALVFVVTFAQVIIPAAVIIALGVIATFSTSYKRVIRIPPAIELVTFTTVMVSLLYGPWIGAVYAAVVSISAEIMTNALDIFIITFVPGRMVVALFSGFLFGLFDGNVVSTGIAATLLYNLVAQPFYLFMADVEMRAKALYFMFVNIGTNMVWFILLGNTVARLIGII